MLIYGINPVAGAIVRTGFCAKLVAPAALYAV